MKRILIIGLIVMMTAAVGCTSQDVEPDNGGNPPSVGQSKVKEADVVGKILEVDEGGKQILVESISSIVEGQIWVSIEDTTNFFEDMPEDIAIGYRDVSRDFQVGNYVQIIIDGGINESYPMQASADAVCVNESDGASIADCSYYDPQIHGIFKTGIIEKIDIENSKLIIRSQDETYTVALTENTNYVFKELEALNEGEEITVCAEYVEEGVTDLTAKEIKLEEEFVLEQAEPIDELLKEEK